MYHPGLSRTQKLTAHLVVFALLAVFVSKSLLSESPYSLLYLYGISVTFVLLTTFLTAMFFYKDPVGEAEKILSSMPVQEAPLVSCMVAVFNEEAFVERCILSLLAQDYSRVEFIFVNDKSTDGTGAILDRYAQDGSITVIHLEKNMGKKRALGQAMRIAKGTLFAFSDSDSLWKSDALTRIVKVFQAFPLVGGVSGHGRAMNAGTNTITKMQDSWYEGQFSIRKAFESVFGAVTCVSGPLAVFRKEAIFNFIPAWEHDTFLGQEFKFATDRTLTGFVLGSVAVGPLLKHRFADSDFVTSRDYPVRDWKIVYAKSAKSWTVVPDTLAKVFKQQIRWKKSFIRNIFFTGAFFWKKPFLPALFYYLHILFVLIGPLIAFRHLVYLPASGDVFGPVLYVSGILFVGFMFGLAFKIENRDSHLWVYRPLMSLFSTLVLSWLVFYSAATIRKSIWARG